MGIEEGEGVEKKEDSREDHIITSQELNGGLDERG